MDVKELEVKVRHGGGIARLYLSQSAVDTLAKEAVTLGLSTSELLRQRLRLSRTNPQDELLAALPTRPEPGINASKIAEALNDSTAAVHRRLLALEEKGLAGSEHGWWYRT